MSFLQSQLGRAGWGPSTWQPTARPESKYNAAPDNPMSLPTHSLLAARQAAVKKLPLSKTTDLPALQNEIAMMRTSAHPNVVEYLESYMFERCLWVAMEYMDGGSLTNLVRPRLPTAIGFWIGGACHCGWLSQWYAPACPCDRLFIELWSRVSANMLGWLHFGS